MNLGCIIKSSLILLALTLFGCGGGGSGSTTSTNKLALRLSTSGSLTSENTIKSISVEINLPNGVSVKTDNNGVLASDLLPSGLATAASYISGSLSGSTLTINFANTNGITVGEFATLYCEVANNSPSPLGNFSIKPGYKIVGYDSSTGNTVRFSEAPYNLSITMQQ